MKKQNKEKLTGKALLYERIRELTLLISAAGMIGLGVLNGTYREAAWYPGAYQGLLICVILTLILAAAATFIKARYVKENRESLRRKSRRR